MKKVKVDTFQDKAIYLDTQTEEFSCGTITSKSLYEVKKQLEIESKTEFTANFFTRNYNGIKKFIAKKRFYSDYDDEWKVRGIEIDNYGNECDKTVAEKELYPANKTNKTLYEEGEKLRCKGWSLIHEAERQKNKLVKLTPNI